MTSIILWFRKIGAISWLIFVGACASTEQQPGATHLRAAAGTPAPAKSAPDPRPLGMPDDATPEERGREILRVIVEIIKRRDFRDTEFAARLLQLPIEKDKAIVRLEPDHFPQQLVNSFSYGGGEFSNPQLSMGFSVSRTCVRSEDLLEVFHREFGIGRKLIRDREAGKSVRVPPSEGWYLSSGHRHSGTPEHASVSLGNHWGASFFVQLDTWQIDSYGRYPLLVGRARCILQIAITDYTPKPKPKYWWDSPSR